METKKYDASFDDSFYKLAAEITRVLEKNKDGTIQKEQVEELLDAEKKFKEVILKYRQTTEIYKKFLQKVCVQNKNILSARPYFRESAVAFSKKVTPAIKAFFGPNPSEAINVLKTFDINYQLIKFIKDSWLGPFPKRADQLFKRVYIARTKLIENNMPLAINRAKLFYRKTPKSHLTLMDLIGICAMGLAIGIDKYRLTKGGYSPVFRSVCISRMVGDMIDSYSETMLHFYPSDKRILYHANKFRSRMPGAEVGELAEAINSKFKSDQLEGKTVPKTNLNASELNSLMTAASTVSADSTVNEEGYGIYQYTEDTNQNIEKSYIERESTIKMLTLAKKLPILHRKVLRLKGIRV